MAAQVLVASNKVSFRAEICLYGNREVGAGWLISIEGDSVKVRGSGEPVKGVTFTQAVSEARDMIVAVVAQMGVNPLSKCELTIHMPGTSGRYARYSSINDVPNWFGDIKWSTDTIHYTVTIA